MGRYTGPKHKLARREGVNIYGKASASLDRRLNVPPGQISRRGGRRRMSEYGLQLREKQKLKRIYGLMEKQFRNYVEKAEKTKTAPTDEVLIQLLESRLDNIVYRLGFAKSRNQARQYVSHKHVLVNGKRVNIPSYQVNEGDEVELEGKLQKNEILKAQREEMEITVPEYLKKAKSKGSIKRTPTKEDVQNPVDYQLVVEFYSR